MANADAWVLTQLGDIWDNHTTGAIGRLQRGMSPEQSSRAAMSRRS